MNEPRKGQWIKFGKQVGIWYDGKFHAVNADGTTKEILDVSPSKLVEVTNVRDLPVSRRTHLADNYNPAMRK